MGRYLRSLLFSSALADWRAGSYEVSQGRTTTQVEFVSTLWEATVKVSVRDQEKEETSIIDDTCGESNLSDEAKSRCGKIGAVRTFVFLELLVCLASIACPVVWLCADMFQISRITGNMQKGLLIAAVSCNAAASLCALLAVIVASTFDFGDSSEDVGVNGGGFVFTILSIVLCLVPSIVLDALTWRWAYVLPANTTPAAHPQDMPEVADLPNLVGAKQLESDLYKTQRDDVEAVTPARERTQV